MAKVTVTRRGPTFAKIIEELTSEATMREAGNLVVDRIKQRTLAGLDENRRRFEPYAESTRTGRKRFNTRGAVVDLSQSGEMLEDFAVVRASRKGFVLGFLSERSAKLARYHQEGTSRMPARRFLGVPASWVDDIVALIKRRMPR